MIPINLHSSATGNSRAKVSVRLSLYRTYCAGCIRNRQIVKVSIITLIPLPFMIDLNL